MRILTHTVTAAEDGQTAKQLLRGLWHISGSLLSRLKFRDAITANGVPVPVNHILRILVSKLSHTAECKERTEPQCAGGLPPRHPL